MTAISGAVAPGTQFCMKHSFGRPGACVTFAAYDGPVGVRATEPTGTWISQVKTAPDKQCSSGPSTSASPSSTSTGPNGTITGTLEAVGGPPGPPRPVPGQVTASGGGHTYSTAVGETGHYSLSLPPGTYTVAGRSPLYEDGAAECQAQGPVTVRTSGSITADVACQEK